MRIFLNAISKVNLILRSVTATPGRVSKDAVAVMQRLFPKLSGAQRRTFGIVAAEIRHRAGAVGDGVAIDAAMRTGVVGADVARQRAAAARAIATLSRGDRPRCDI